jgi:hypothetical protein
MPLPFAFISVRGLELLGLLFWIWMIYECAKRERGSERILWLLLVVCVPDIGALVYFLFRIARIRG